MDTEPDNSAIEADLGLVDDDIRSNPSIDSANFENGFFNCSVEFQMSAALDFMDTFSDEDADKDFELSWASTLPPGLPGRNSEAINTVNQSFETASEVDFAACGSSSPVRPDTPAEDRLEEGGIEDDADASTPRPVRQQPAAKWKIVNHVRSQRGWLSDPRVVSIRRIINQKLGLIPKPWQVSVMINAIYDKKDAVVSAGTGSGKSLPYTLIPLVLKTAIVLVVSPTIALMNDQCQSATRMGVRAVALTSETTREDPWIWSDINKGIYSLVLASPEILLSYASPFWLQTVRDRSNGFCCRLACIAVDEAHLLWGWREFRKEYSNVGKLRMYFPDVPIMALSATITRNVLEYTRESLNLCAPVCLYKRSLDRPNITYMVQEIKKKGFLELNILIPRTGAVGDIPKTMLFVDNIDEGIAIAFHLQSLLPESMRSAADEIIRAFSSDLEATTKKDFMQDFQSGDTRIWVCTDAAGMGIDLRDVARAIQWKIRDHVNLAVLLQRIGRAGRNAQLPAVSVIFVEKKHFLPENIATIEDSPFRDYTTAIGPRDNARAAELISKMYENGFLHKKEKVESPVHAIDPAVLWFINTIGCRRCLALACFMSEASAATNRGLVCCDNCIYNQHTDEEREIPLFEKHDISARHCRRYLATNECQEIQRNEVVRPRRRGVRTKKVDQKAVQLALSRFAALTWPKGMARYVFPDALRAKVATRGARIATVEDLRDALHPKCDLETSLLRVQANKIVDIVSSTMLSAHLREDGPIDEDDSSSGADDNNREMRNGGRSSPRATGTGTGTASTTTAGDTSRARGRPRGSQTGPGRGRVTPWDQPPDWQIVPEQSQNTTRPSQVASDASQVTQDASQAALDASQAVSEQSQATTGPPQVFSSGPSQVFSGGLQVSSGRLHVVPEQLQATSGPSQVFSGQLQGIAGPSQEFSGVSQATTSQASRSGPKTRKRNQAAFPPKDGSKKKRR